MTTSDQDREDYDFQPVRSHDERQLELPFNDEE